MDGKDVRKVTLKSLRDHIGMVQQDVYLFAGTIFENIRYGKPDATREEVIAAAKMPMPTNLSWHFPMDMIQISDSVESNSPEDRSSGFP